MIQIVGISGSPVADGNTELLLRETLALIAPSLETRQEIYNLAGRSIAGCRHCNWCVKNQNPEKFCVIADGMDEIYPALLRADVVILATPVHINRMSGLMANMIDRMRGFVYGNAHGGKLKDKVGGVLITAFLRHGGLETTLAILNTTFSLFYMIPVGRGGLVLTSQDGKGKTVKGIRHMAKEDAFGLSSCKDMILRSVELARIIQAGKKALKKQ